MSVAPAAGGFAEEYLSFHPQMYTYANGTDALVEVRGDLDAYSAGGFTTAVVQVLRERPLRVFVGLTDVPFIDSSGLLALSDAWRKARAQGCELILCAPRAPVARVLEMSGLRRVMEGKPGR